MAWLWSVVNALLFGACLAGVLVWLFTGESAKVVPLDTEDWTEYLGEKASTWSLPLEKQKNGYVLVRAQAR